IGRRADAGQGGSGAGGGGGRSDGRAGAARRRGDEDAERVESAARGQGALASRRPGRDRGGRRDARYDPVNDIPAELTTLCSSIFHCSYFSSSPRTFGIDRRNV